MKPRVYRVLRISNLAGYNKNIRNYLKNNRTKDSFIRRKSPVIKNWDIQIHEILERQGVRNKKVYY